MTTPKVNEVWWVSVVASKYAPLIRRRIEKLSKEMVVLGDPELKPSNYSSKSYIRTSVRFVECIKWNLPRGK